MKILRRNSLFAVNVVLPLMCGLFIYLTKPETSLLSHLFAGFCSVLPVIRYPLIIQYYAADFLWAYSLFFCLRLSLGDELKGKYNVFLVLLEAVVAMLLEYLQILRVVPGTFDIFDMGTELLAIFIGLLVLNIIEWRNRDYEKE